MLHTETDLFYADLPCVSSFAEIIKLSPFRPVPADWLIVITDVKGSTAAIASGRYKEVNFLGASTIAAVLNGVSRLEIPFVFGGDGATLLVPSSYLAETKQALLAVQRYARLAFGMTLRAGIVPVAEVLRAGREVLVARLEMMPGSTQAHFAGGGLSYATELVKDDRLDNPWQVWEFEVDAALTERASRRRAGAKRGLSTKRNARQSTKPLRLNLDGLECRWQDLHYQPREILSLIVSPLQEARCWTGSGGELRCQKACYQDTMTVLEQLYGGEANFRPVLPHHLKLTFNPRKLMIETKLRSRSTRWRDRLQYLTGITVQNGLGWLLMRQGLVLGGTDWGRYKPGVVSTVDYCKVDDVLRMVIASDAPQTAELLRYLEAEYRAGRLVYGLHRSNRALMTCVVFDRNGRQVHFVDGADGGYTAAAVDLKRRLARVEVNC